eukprot:m.209675 g.209675  ORF g.209675 m.209675 type:complete len:499 (+) comp33048_c0_seq4:288-1784(+)
MYMLSSCPRETHTETYVPGSLDLIIERREVDPVMLPASFTLIFALSLLIGTVSGAAGGATCLVAPSIECKEPPHFDEVNASDVDGCCAVCDSDPKCIFWSFKASDISNGIACKKFDSMPTLNKTDSEFISGSVQHRASTVRLRINGSRVIDNNGNDIRLVGLNWPLIHVHDGDGELMKQTLPGVNMARIIGVLWDNSHAKSDCMTDTAPYFNDDCFGDLDAAVKAATDAKLWVILAARCAFAAGQDYLTDPNANVFHNTTLRNMLFVMWEHVASHYKDWDYIGAYEVMAEPRDKLATAAMIRDFYAGACAAAQTADPNTPCMIGPGPYYKLWNFNESILLSQPNVIYTFDYFQPTDFVFGQSDIPLYPDVYNCSTLYSPNWVDQCCPDGGSSKVSFDANWSLSNFEKFAVPLQQHHNVPIIVNQWSVVHGVPKSAGRFQYMRDVARALQQLNIGWAWWVFRGGGDGWSHGSSEIVYQWTNGTLEVDTEAVAALSPFVD